MNKNHISSNVINSSTDDIFIDLEFIILDLKQHIISDQNTRALELVNELNSLEKSLKTFIRKVPAFCISDVFQDVAHSEIPSALIQCSIDSFTMSLNLAVGQLESMRDSFPAPKFLEMRSRPEYVRIWNEKLERDARREAHFEKLEIEAKDRIDRKTGSEKQFSQRSRKTKKQSRK